VIFVADHNYGSVLLSSDSLLKESLLLPVFRDEYIFLHDEYQQHVLPHIVELKKQAKAERSKARDADAEYHLAKSIEKQICEVHDTAINNADSIHCEHRLFLKRELGRMVLFLTDQPTLLPPNLQVSIALPLQTVVIVPKMQLSLFFTR
jgi:NCK-associated protein 1